MSVYAALRGGPEALDELHLTRRGEIEKAAFLQHRPHDRGVGHRLERVVQIDTGERLAQLPVLHPHTLAVENQQRRAELFDESADLCGLERVDEWCATDPAFHHGSTAIAPVSSL